MHIHKYLLLLFTLSEVLLLVSKRSKTTSTKSRDDRMSLLLFWITIPVCFVMGDMIAEQNIGFPIDGHLLKNAGIVVFIIGFAIRWISIFQLGKMFTVDVSISSAHVLKTDGLYKIVRHPSYLGLLLIIVGISFFMSNILSSIVVIVPIFLATNYRISVEEKALTAEFGSQYEDYKRRMRKIVPGGILNKGAI
jgi:protein-S-isoprenylcysteine O-methyltransferase Ste14